MVTSIDRDRDKTIAREIAEQRALRFLVSARAVKRNDHRSSSGHCFRLHENARHALALLRGITKRDFHQTVVFRWRGMLWIERNLRTIDQREKRRTGVS